MAGVSSDRLTTCVAYVATHDTVSRSIALLAFVAGMLTDRLADRG